MATRLLDNTRRSKPLTGSTESRKRNGLTDSQEIKLSKSNNSLLVLKGSTMKKNISYDKMTEQRITLVQSTVEFRKQQGKSAAALIKELKDTVISKTLPSPNKTLPSPNNEHSDNVQISQVKPMRVLASSLNREGLITSGLAQLTEEVPIFKRRVKRGSDALKTRTSFEDVLMKKTGEPWSPKVVSKKQPNRSHIGKNMSDLTGSKKPSAVRIQSPEQNQLPRNNQGPQSPTSPAKSTQLFFTGYHTSQNTLSNADRKVLVMPAKKPKSNLEKTFFKDSSPKSIVLLNYGSGSSKIMFPNSPSAKNTNFAGLKEKGFSKPKMSREMIRYTSPMPLQDVFKKSGVRTSSTLQTATVASNTFRSRLIEAKLFELKLVGFDIDGTYICLAHVEEHYESQPLFQEEEENSVYHQREAQRLLRGYCAIELSEPKFFAPKATAISVFGFKDIDTSHTKLNLDFESRLFERRPDLNTHIVQGRTHFGNPHALKTQLAEMELELPSFKNLQSAVKEPLKVVQMNSLVEQAILELPIMVLTEDSVSQNILDTPSFTTLPVKSKSNDFTFGKSSCEEPKALVESASHQSMTLQAGFDPARNDSMCEGSVGDLNRTEGYNSGVLKPKKSVLSQRDNLTSFVLGKLPMPKADRSILSDRDQPFFQDKTLFGNLSETVDDTKHRKDHLKINISSLTEKFGIPHKQLQVEEPCPQDSHDESTDRFNLYRHQAASDSEEDYEGMGSDLCSGSSSEYSNRCRIYNNQGETMELESSQFFLDEELKNKYQSLLQNNN